MKIAKIATHFSKVRGNDLSGMTFNIVEKINASEDYKTLLPLLPAIKTTADEYVAALTKSIKGSVADTAFKNQKRKSLEKLLSGLAVQVSIIADGDQLKLENSGFQLVKSRVYKSSLPAPETVKFETGENPGKIYFIVSKVYGARGYLLALSLSPASEKMEDWKVKFFSSSSRGEITGLESGKKYTIKAAALGSESNKIESLNFSQPIEWTVN